MPTKMFCQRLAASITHRVYSLSYLARRIIGHRSKTMPVCPSASSKLLATWSRTSSAAQPYTSQQHRFSIRSRIAAESCI